MSLNAQSCKEVFGMQILIENFDQLFQRNLVCLCLRGLIEILIKYERESLRKLGLMQLCHLTDVLTEVMSNFDKKLSTCKQD